MKHLTLLLSGVIVLTLLSIYKLDMLMLIIISGLSFVIIAINECYFTKSKVYTNKEITMLGDLEKVDGACNNTITYLYSYKGKQYLITYAGDLELLDPNKEAITI